MSEQTTPTASRGILHRHAMHCANCGEELHGPYCAHCGQPVTSFIRALWGLVYELLDDFFSFDSRAFRTLPPLLFRPGFLTNEYIAGRRARYVRPLRLYLFISIIFFLVVSVFAVDETRFEDVNVNIADQADPERTVSALEQALRQLELSVEDAPEESRQQTRATIESLRRELEAARERAAREESAAETGQERSMFDWDEERLQAFLEERGRRVVRNPARFMDKLFGALPQTMFLLLPLFAFLLKLFYIFRKRFYTEHLIVALHSHSFMFLAFLLLYLVSASTDALAGVAGGMGPGVRTAGTWLQIALGIWIPVYLFLMQKRVYRQGWFMTFIKFSLIGILYITLLSFTLAAAALIGFVTT